MLRNCTENRIVEINEIVTLYHGSKAGICGTIAPISRDCCDFGKGFYMGTDRMQPLTLICNYPKAKLYTLGVDLSGLKILDLEVGLDWALLVVLDRFFNGEITDTALINSLSALKLGKQYVALTENACKRIQILEEQEISVKDRGMLKEESEANRSKGIAMADEICQKYRREGLFFDEILKAGE